MDINLTIPRLTNSMVENTIESYLDNPRFPTFQLEPGAQLQIKTVSRDGFSYELQCSDCVARVSSSIWVGVEGETFTFKHCQRNFELTCTIKNLDGIGRYQIICLLEHPGELCLKNRTTTRDLLVEEGKFRWCRVAPTFRDFISEEELAELVRQYLQYKPLLENFQRRLRFLTPDLSIREWLMEETLEFPVFLAPNK